MEQELTALLASASARRYWGRAPETPPKRPYLRLTRIGGDRDYHNQGSSGLVASRVQIDVLADTYTSASTTAAAVVSALSGYRGGTIQVVFVDSERDLSGIDGIGGEVDPNQLYRRTIDVMVHHTSA